jgi:hypothetical protein
MRSSVNAMLDPAMLLAAASCITACVSGPACPPGRVCGNAAWYVAANGAPVEGRVVIAPLTAVGGASSDGTEAMTVSARPVYLRFDLGELPEGTIERAVVSLAPHPSWHPRGPSRIIARGIASEWSSAGVANASPAMQSDLAGEVIVPGGTRTPVRIDVTPALRGFADGSTGFDGIALVADGAPVAFAGLAIDSVASRPRLEMVVR